jgi:type IV pilus assembly protein PilB
MEKKQKKRLGDVLVQQGTLSEQDLNRAVALQNEKVMRLGEILLQDGFLSKSDIGNALEQVQGVPYAECPPEAIEAAVLERVSLNLALRCCALPLEVKGRELIIAMAEPQNLTFLDELRFRAGMEISPRFSFRDDILIGIKKFYGTHNPDGTDDQEPGDDVDLSQSDAATADVEFITADSREENRVAMKELRATRQKTPAVRFVSNILALAAQKQASDIHIEPRVGSMIVRIRVDGILRELMTVPPQYQAAVISRIKILADMDIAERRVPQDGRFLMQYQGHRLDLRTSTLPTHFGEKVALRILDPRSAIITLDKLGLAEAHARDIQKLLSGPQGMLLVTGPTGAGKSTTLYAGLNVLRSPGRNIITVEDPVEYMLDGVNQVQVHPKAGLTFASCLPSILRQDPDVIMVGEIRDGETAEIALKASQTGHLVLSTLHTNDSVSSITRLLDLGVPAYLIASSIAGVLAQRLVRRLCNCRKKEPATSEYIGKLESLGVTDTHTFTDEFHPVGCVVCENTGFKGRIGIYELLVVEGPIREAIHSNVRAEDILSTARASGFRTMQEDALQKVKDGLTSLQEVRRVVPFEAPKLERCESCGREIMSAFAYCPFCSTVRRNVTGPFVHR